MTNDGCIWFHTVSSSTHMQCPSTIGVGKVITRWAGTMHATRCARTDVYIQGHEIKKGVVHTAFLVEIDFDINNLIPHLPRCRDVFVHSKSDQPIIVALSR